MQHSALQSSPFNVSYADILPVYQRNPWYIIEGRSKTQHRKQKPRKIFSQKHRIVVYYSAVVVNGFYQWNACCFEKHLTSLGTWNWTGLLLLVLWPSGFLLPDSSGKCNPSAVETNWQLIPKPRGELSTTPRQLKKFQLVGIWHSHMERLKNGDCGPLPAHAHHRQSGGAGHVCVRVTCDR